MLSILEAYELEPIVRNDKVYYAGQIKPGDSCELSFANSGLLYGESVFTTLRTYKKRALFLEKHLQRLVQGSETLFPLTLKRADSLFSDIRAGIDTILKDSEEDLTLRVTIFEEGSHWVEDESFKRLDFFIAFKPLKKLGIRKPVKLKIAETIKAPSILPPFLKVGSYAESFMELNLAKKKGFDDAVYLTHDGLVSECTTSNIFFVKDNIIHTPKVNTCLLTGITRSILIEALQRENIEVLEGSYKIEDFYNADEVFTTSSVKGIRSVVQIEDHNFNSVERCDELNSLFWEYVEKGIE